eukprot:scpid78435/ scgid1918/ E3 ubiquitin-protein ligase HECW2; HECT, C2 and WW domain-containing protein 2; NEDD4-like E3 ubiquitin-protein ligase 2
MAAAPALRDVLSDVSRRRLESVSQLVRPRRGTVSNGSESSLLAVDKRTAHVGETVQVKFDIKSTCDPHDWIGLYLADNTNPNNYLEYRNRGLTGGQIGTISWLLEPHIFISQPGSTTKVQFCYYHSDGGLEAMSAPIIVTLPASSENSGSGLYSSTEETSAIQVSQLYARDLKKKKFSRPDPILRLRVVPGPSFPWLIHHEQQNKTHRCKSTCNPVWTGEVFQFQVISSDVLEFMIKGKNPGDGGFLGKSSLSMNRFVGEEQGADIVLHLDRRFPGENITGVVCARIDWSRRASERPRLPPALPAAVQGRTTQSDESDSELADANQGSSTCTGTGATGSSSTLSTGPAPSGPSSNGSSSAPSSITSDPPSSRSQSSPLPPICDAVAVVPGPPSQYMVPRDTAAQSAPSSTRTTRQSSSEREYSEMGDRREYSDLDRREYSEMGEQQQQQHQLQHRQQQHQLQHRQQQHQLQQQHEQQ